MTATTSPARVAKDGPRLWPAVAVAMLWRRRALLWRFTFADALGKYRGSWLGIGWSFLNPLLMLAVFTVAFGAVFKGASFANGLPARPAVLPIFCGMVVFGIFGEVLSRAPTAVLAHPNYVKKIVFPLEILPAAITGSALLHACIGLCILLVGQLALGVVPGAAALWLPVVLLPIVLLALGAGWWLASLGVYVRDIGHGMNVVTQALFFLTPVVYPFEAIERGAGALAAVLACNPLKIVIDDARLCLLWNTAPPPLPLGGALLVALVFAAAGLLWFERTRKGFADVV